MTCLNLTKLFPDDLCQHGASSSTSHLNEKQEYRICICEGNPHCLVPRCLLPQNGPGNRDISRIKQGIHTIL